MIEKKILFLFDRKLQIFQSFHYLKILDAQDNFRILFEYIVDIQSQ